MKRTKVRWPGRLLSPLNIACLAILALFAARCGGTERPGVNPASQSHSALVSSPGPLTLTMDAPAPLVQGSFGAYTVTVTNTTADPIAFNLGLDFPNTTVTGLPAGCTGLGGNSGLFVCIGLSLDPGATQVVQFQIRPQIAGPNTFGASVVGASFPNNALNDTQDVAPAPTDVQVTGSSNNGSPQRGSAFKYTFQVKNNGPFATFGGVSFTDALPASLTFLDVSTDIGACTGGATVSCDLGDLPVGVQATIRIVVQAPAVPGSIANTASIAIGQQTDRNPANDSVTVTVTPK
jgi:uncharacterized repeat protein (TIGR01451 family)